jgi:hypothetical protein
MGITNIHNYSMNFSNFRKIYLDSIPLIVKFTSSAGLFTGVYANMIMNNNKKI